MSTASTCPDSQRWSLHDRRSRSGDGKQTRTFATPIDIPESSREAHRAAYARLADTFDLYSQLNKAHWNLKGSDFIQFHELYDTVAESVLEHVDEIAERATALGGLALGTARIAAAASTLEEYPLNTIAGMDTVEVIRTRDLRLAKPNRKAVRQTCLEALR